MKGRFIVLEGIDGSGKTTLSKNLQWYLDFIGKTSILTFEPTLGSWGEMIRSKSSTPYEEIEMFFSDREEHVNNVIKPSLDNGITVICDRYYHSSAVYQGTMAGNPHDIIKRNEEKFPIPDLVFLIDISSSLSHSRIKERGGEPDKFESDVFMMEKYRQLYLNLFSNRRNIHILDGRKSENDLYDNARKILDKTGWFNRYS